MTHLSTLADWLGERLPELIAEHRVPGAVIGVYAHGEYLERAAGVLNTRTGVPVTTDSLFQIGSSPRSGRPPWHCNWSRTIPERDIAAALLTNGGEDGSPVH
jgi:hypothetical protein